MSKRVSTRTRTDHGPRGLRPAAVLARGDILANRYVIRSGLGRGGTGEVFKTYDRATKSVVALKVLRAGRGSERNTLDRLGQEVRHARAVHHPNVCRVFELHESGGFTFFTMELGRESLRVTLEKRTSRPIAERMADAQAVTAGLEAIHAAGIIHRDLKPENLLRMADGRLVVSDFGLARELGGCKDARGGTEGYLAPEVRKGRPPTRRSDVWSLGIVLHELLLGGRPEANSSPRGTPLEATLAELCRACTALSPGRRPVAAEVLRRLTEWDGETLDQRLRRGRLRAHEALAIAAQVLEAVASIHRAGDIHGAITPANVFISRREGAARLLRPGRDPLASTTAPAYLAHEQARQERGVDESADVFAVGCVLLTCLTGKPLDAGLAQQASLTRRSLGKRLEVATGAVLPAARPVLRRMLAATTGQRAADAGALARELADLAATVPTRGTRSRSASAALEGEQSVGSVVAVRVPGRTIPAQALAGAESFGATSMKINATCFQAVIQGGGTPSDLAVRAAGCAVTLQAALPGAAFAIGTGRLWMRADGPAGEAAARALQLLEQAPGGDIHLDAASATLLSSRFRIREGSPPALLGERSPVDRPRTVLGKETPCLGRERELSTLLHLWEECSAEPVARTVLVTAPAGTGKSRLRHELTERIQRSEQSCALLIGRGDPLRAGAPFAMLGPVLRAAAGLHAGEPPAVARQRLLAYVSRHFAVERAARLTAFLGEIANVPFPDDDLPALQAARQDPRLMADQTEAAWLELLEAECDAHPVLLVLEDLHWGDAPSVHLVDTALRILRQKPLMVLALGRPELDDRFPNLWSERAPTRISLPPLTTRSAQKLLLAAASGLSAAEVHSIVERADGNPFYLEELVRTVGAGTGVQALPETVMGTVQARLEALGPEPKRVLRAGAVFGESFRYAGVRHLLGGQPDRDLDRWLDLLVQKEVLFPRNAGENQELVFRHGLLQEAAYGMLTPEDRVLAHRLAGEHLEATGERQAILLVEHYERSGERRKAAHWCRRAAQQEMDANDLGAAIERVQRGIALGADGELLAALRLVEAQARFWRGEYAQAELAARAAVSSVSEDMRLSAVGELLANLGQQGKFADMAEICRDQLLPQVEARPLGSWLGCGLRAITALLAGGQYEVVESLLRRIATDSTALTLGQRARLQAMQGVVHFYRGAPSRALQALQAALRDFETLGDTRSSTEAKLALANALIELGVFEDAEEFLCSAVETTKQRNLLPALVIALVNLTDLRVNMGRTEEARVTGEQARSMAHELGDRRVEGGASIYLSLAASLAGAPVEAERHARSAVAILAGVPALLPTAMAGLARVLLPQNRITEAIDLAREAYGQLVRLGGVEEGEASIYLVYAECLLRHGQRDEARDLLARSVKRLEERCHAIDTPAWRSAFLRRLPDNARTLDLARTLGVSSPLLEPATGS
jgi:serine/threonine protein kinase/tetratricopeptide (TPR) repeat protein